MSYILNIETTTKNCSVSLAHNGVVVALQETATEGFSHAENLHVFIAMVLNDAQVELQQLAAIAVSKGPGSYTGLRIGVSAAKGLSYALKIPLIAIDTLQILASKANIKDGFVIPMIDARRMEVYSAIFDANSKPVRAVEAEVITENSFANVQGKCYFIGDCNEKCQTVLTAPNFNFIPQINYPSANEMGSISFEKYSNQDFVDVAYFEPFYLKDFMITKSLK